jgi:hypothetical protein
VDEAAIDRAIAGGVAGLRRMQRADGTWPHENVGATALAGLTLLECGDKADDKAVKAALAVVRKAAPTHTTTYGLALSILFLDRLDDPADVPLIESMTLRLLAGQNAKGCWSYSCPSVSPAEVRRLTAVAAGEKGSADPPKLPAKGERRVAHLSREIQAQLPLINPGGFVGDGGIGDNSNTQFAALAMWAGRRYGMPTQAGLLRVDAHFRATQNSDGGWSYTPMLAVLPPPGVRMRPGMGSTATMTCAGILGLAVGHGGAIDLKRAKDKDGKVKPRDITKDVRLMAALRLLGTAIGQPIGEWRGPDRRRIPSIGGKGYYFLWSLERVAVALDLKTIGKKDWYAWGAEILLTNQQVDGTWRGEYGDSGADTCFALLFLKRANLTRDLTSSLKGVKDPGERGLRGGLLGKGGLKDVPDKPLEMTGIGEKKPAPKGPATGREEAGPARLGKELVRASAERRAALLRQLRDGKGGAYTDALVAAIPQLEGQALRQARQALAERLTRMKVTTLRTYLKDEDPEVRRAAALASTAKDDGKVLIPDLIRLLNDREVIVERAAHTALKDLSGRDFGPAADASRTERSRAIAAWLAWWKKTARD